jgi:hypothetical protein
MADSLLPHCASWNIYTGPHYWHTQVRISLFDWLIIQGKNTKAFVTGKGCFSWPWGSIGQYSATANTQASLFLKTCSGPPEKYESRITIDVKITHHGIKIRPIITRVNPSERREHPPSFTCDSLDFKHHVPFTLETPLLREYKTLRCIDWYYLKCMLQLRMW